MIASFERARGGLEIPNAIPIYLGIDHRYDANRIDACVDGWVFRLWHRYDGQLWASVELSDRAEAGLVQKKWPFCSAAFYMQHRDAETGECLGAKLIELSFCDHALPIAGRLDTSELV